MSTAKLEPRGGEGDKIEVSTREELVDRVRERLGFRRRGCRRERGREGLPCTRRLLTTIKENPCPLNNERAPIWLRSWHETRLPCIPC